MLKNKSTYEIIEPEKVGIVRKDAAGIVMGKHSGRHALRTRMSQLGVELEGELAADLAPSRPACVHPARIVPMELLIRAGNAALYIGQFVAI